MSTPAVEQPVPPQQALAWEASQRTRSGIAGVLAAILTLAASVSSGLITADLPHILAVNALKDGVGESASGAPGLKTAQLIYIDDHSIQLILVAILLSLGSLLMIPILGYLHRASAARSTRATKLALIAALVGPVCVAVGGLILQIFICIKASDFASSPDHSTQAAHDALTGPIFVSMTLLRSVPGVLVVALAFILISLNAMRVGLLTRFMGMLGIIAGGLVLVGPIIAPQLAALPVIEVFWLFAVGLLVLGRWPGGKIPPAWVTGTAVPWPSQQELREERERELKRRKSEKSAKDDDDGTVIDAAPTPMPVPRDEDDDVRAGTPHSSSKKRKRKRR
jgi:MFS family permease